MTNDAAVQPELTAPGAAEPAATTQERPRRRWPVQLAKGAAILVVGLVLLVALVIFGLDTQPGRRLVANQIAGLTFESGMKIRIGRIDGSLYGEMTLHDLAVADPRGVFVRSPQVAVDWRPFAFFKNHIDIRDLAAQRVVLERLPQFNEVADDGSPLLPDLDIDVNWLRVDRLIVEAPVTGERRIATVAGEAHIADRRALIDLNARTIGEGDAAFGDTLALKLDAVPEQNRLGIALKLQSPQTGVITSLAGLDQAVMIELAGQGTWQSWNGTVAADLGGAEFARLSLAARDGTFAVKGPVRAARLMEGQVAALLGDVTDVDLVADVQDRRAQLAGTISSDAFRLAANGAVDLANNAFDALKLDFLLLQPSVLMPDLRGSGLRADLVLNGSFATPEVAYALSASRVAIAGVGVVGLAANGSAQVSAERIVIPVRARAARISGFDSVAGGTLVNLNLSGDIAIKDGRVLADNLRIRSNRIDAGVVLLADLSKGTYSGAIDGRIDDYRLESVGTLNIGADVDFQTSASGVALAGKVRARSTRLANDSVRDFLGGNAVGSATIRYTPDGLVRFSALRLEAPLARIVSGSGSYRPGGQIMLNADAITNAYGRVGVRVAGTIANPRARVTAERPGLGIGLANVTAQINGTGNAGYRLDLAADTDYGPLTADVVLGTGEALTLDINTANLGGIDFAGSLRQTASGPFAGRLTANGRGLAGVVRLAATDGVQEALFNLRARDAQLDGPADLAIGSAKIDGRVVLYELPYVVADVQLAQARYGGFDIAAARALINYRDGRGQAKLLVEGARGAPFRIAGNLDLQPQLWRAAIEGRTRGVTFRTVNPARIIPGEDGYELLPTKIDLGKGSIRLAGTYGEGLKVQSRLDALDLAIINSFVPEGLGIGGTATGSLDFAQSSAAAFPRADARMTIRNFTRSTAALISNPVDINFVGKLLNDGGEARAVLRRRGTAIGRMVASLRPLPPGAGPWTQRLLGAPLSGGIRYNGPADTLFSFSGLADQQFAGPIGIAADFSGRLSAPQLNGVVRANSLTYENLTYGTRLTDMSVQARFDGSRLEVQRLQARAGSGEVSASGSVSLSAESGYPIDIAVTLDDARLARSEMISASATGQMRLSKNPGETALLSGELRLPEARYEIIRQAAAEVPQLTGVRFKKRRAAARITGDELPDRSAGVFTLLRLDIDLKANEQLYVSGMGLESEWSADLGIGGTSAQPTLAGEIELIRGTLGFAGRSFELTDGRINFTGGQAIDPTIRISASDDIEDVTVNINVTGRAFDPQIAFSSTPGLPEDEIVSRILFGSSIGNLSTIQAVQLAASLNSLRGSGGGLNPLGTLRTVAGIDRLRILGADEQNGRGTALAAGEYITDDIYVEIITDAKGFTATQLEISLTPALSILTQAGGSGDTDFNIRYRKNY
ncbi:translocation/assembly module TamB domain-containing protein [Croceicoccus sp. F390]|uniref:Translocation/assembly module TamB domain-containing protein n=1 Tax=Croceicoccus esteveae TaxID=3075597 RepID=A0ABU2ZFD1_9SPHN|nr:translocation/assembly module TamB domain-containing protein [Croceicoccus sp. F390]MDT0575300.1 translocation/assembly module TamB domain-containing protein [Croceicoccus sp. F390]